MDLGDLPDLQVKMWHALFDFADMFPTGWTLVGGQMVALHAWGSTPPSAPVATSTAGKRTACRSTC